LSSTVPAALLIRLKLPLTSGLEAPWQSAHDPPPLPIGAVHNASPLADDTPRGPLAALQVPPDGAAQTPLVQETTAVPVVGAVVSDNEYEAPDAVNAASALHVLVPTVQLKACAAQATGAGAAQVAEAGALHVPFVQV
jgi:hypothetical protein